MGCAGSKAAPPKEAEKQPTEVVPACLMGSTMPKAECRIGVDGATNKAKVEIRLKGAGKEKPAKQKTPQKPLSPNKKPPKQIAV